MVMKKASDIDLKDEGSDSDVQLSQQSEAVQREMKVLRKSRFLAAGILFAMAVTIPTLTHVFFMKDDASKCDTKWDDMSNAFLDSVETKMKDIHASLENFASTYPVIADETGNELPFLTIADFEAIASTTRVQTGVLQITYLPVLMNEEMRLTWENYTTENADWVFHAHESSDQSNENQASFFIPDKVWSDANQIQDSSLPPNFPIWQMSPPPSDASVVNFDMAKKTILSTAISSSQFANTGFLVTDLIDKSFVPYNVAKSFLVEDFRGPSASLVLPVFKHFAQGSRDVVGVVVATTSWESLFNGLMREGQEGLQLVVESCNTFFTIDVKGPEATFLEMGDFHDKTFQNYGKALQFKLSSIVESTKNTCEQRLHVYPTKLAMDSCDSDLPKMYTIIMAVLCAVAFIVYCAYGCLHFRCNRKADLGANTSSESSSQSSTPDAGFTEGNNHVDAEKALLSGKGRKFIDGPEGTEDTILDFVKDTTKTATSDTKPLAEFFPEATVLFADIAGFTAWSSIREPSQVFTLLESTFQAFDQIAKKYGVFKVETVGDCYVAVVGVPDYCQDHAIVMVSFAREAINCFNETVRGLELKLGPDTGDLAMRFGIHSGPVTAGVLRGDRARFQLFGDTVNTAARVESTGCRNRIHLSEQTACLILAAGKSTWVTPREDPVEAKGKGIMKTYWLELDPDGVAKSQGDGNQIFQDSNREDASQPQLKRESSFLAKLRNREESQEAKDRKNQRLIEWNKELLLQLLKQVVARRKALQRRQTTPAALEALAKNIGKGSVVDEVAEIIEMPAYDENACRQQASEVELNPEVESQLHDYIAMICSMYRDNPFHNFEHASHVTMSVSKLLSRIKAPQITKEEIAKAKDKEEMLHDHTYGITSDPLTQFSVVLSALIHDVDHRGVPNFVLIAEDKALSAVYKGKSVAEQNSVDIAWDALMSRGFEQLRECIFGDISELKRFRQLLVNSVIATDIFDKELGLLRKSRWDKAFYDTTEEESRVDINRKATIVIEHLIQASDVAHTMQHWHVYQKWNARLFKEMHQAYQEGRTDKDPSVNWYQGELSFFDNYVIPLAKKLKNCGVFGVSSDEYLNYATENRKEWAARGESLVSKMVEEERKAE